MGHPPPPGPAPSIEFFLLMFVGMTAYLTFSVAVIRMFPRFRSQGGRRDAFLKQLLPILAANIAASILSLFAANRSSDLIGYFQHTSTGNHILLTSSAVVIGGILFIARKRARIIYATVELAFAITALAIYPVAPAHAPGSQISAATAAWLLGGFGLIYVLVRGLDNLDSGLTQQRRRSEAMLDTTKAD